MKKLVLVVLILAAAAPASAQLFSVTTEYQVVEVDPAERRIGVALLDARPDVRQNWVYLMHDTRITNRVEVEPGLFREEVWDSDTALARVRPGDRLKVHGGRDFDGSINAKTVSVSGAPGVAAAGVTHSASSWSGVVEEVTERSVLLTTPAGTTVLLPRGLAYRGSLQPGQNVSVDVPAAAADFVTADASVATLSGPAGVYQVPTSALSADAQVPVLTRSGTSLSLPLASALELQRSEGAALVAPRFHSDSALTQGGNGVVLSSTPDFVLVATPGGSLLRLPATPGVTLKRGSGISFQPSGQKVKVKGGKPKGKGKGKGGF